MNIKETIEKMKTEDKVSLLTGKDFWNTRSFDQYSIPSIMMSDGPHGLRCQAKEADMIGVNNSLPATCFPSAVTSSATWNRDLLYREGEAIGKEALKAGVSMVLGPGVNIKRDPLCGRNFEYFSEDPYIAGELAAAFINGQQSTSAASCIKHFALNSKENKRMNSDSIVDERTMREIYFSAFERAVKKSHPETLMCSYNRINGTYASDNRWLLTDVLRKEWGFDGLVVTDWGAMNDRIKGIGAGCDLLMPGGSDYMHKETLAAAGCGELSEEDLDNSVERVLRLVDRNRDPGTDVSFEDHHRLAVEIASEGAVLLKNNGTLPLNSDEIAVFGHMAKEFRYQGAGSSHINPTKLPGIFDFWDVPFEECCDLNGVVDNDSLDRALSLAKGVKKPVIFAGLPDSYESEGFDRTDMKMPAGHIEMIERIAEVNPNTVVVLCGGSAMEVPWIDKVSAVLYMGIAGQGAAEACVSLLTGEITPSGRLSESWPLVYEDVPSSDSFAQIDAFYREGIYVGYRYYDKAGMPVRFPFGYGLSYTSFEYKDLEVDGRRVSVTLTNTGSCKGKETVQLYVRNPEGYRAKRELRDFAKVELEPGETKTVTFELEDRVFEIYDNGFKRIEGTYGIEVGSSSRDIRLSADIEIEGEKMPAAPLWYLKPEGKPEHADHEALMGKPLKVCGKSIFTMNSSLMDMRDSTFLHKIIYNAIVAVVKKQFKGADENDPTMKMMIICTVDLPLRSMVINSGGMMSEKLAHFLVESANGHLLKGLGCLWR